jgi:hypothetical protein
VTRVVSYGLYQCTICQQIHIKPNYGSISVYIPFDVFVDNSGVVGCKGCGLEQAISSFLYIGIRPKQKSHKPNLFERLSIRLGFGEPSAELDVRKLYPALLN